MKFIVTTSALLKHLQAISGVVNTNTVLPILENFLFNLEGDQLTVSATDLETSMITRMSGVDSKEDGKIAIPARMLLDILKSLPEQPITVSVNTDNYQVEITSDKGKYKLAGDNGDEFPRIPMAEDVNQITLNSDVLGLAISKTLFAVSTDELRPAMTGVYFQMDQEGITFVSTDAQKLVRYKRLDSKSDNPASFIVPKKALTLMKAALPGEATQVEISYNSSNAFFSFGEVSMVCRLIDAKYPDINSVIPVDNPNKLTINTADFQNSLKRVSIFANKTTHQILLKISGSEINISSQDLDFSNEAAERLNCNYEGEDLQIAFNGKFLIEMLSVIGSDEIEFEMSTPTRAGIILPGVKEENEELLMLVMPVMLNT